MSPKPLSWQSALSASVVIHALLVGGIGLIFFQSAPVGGSGMLTVDLGGPAGNAGGLGDMHQDGRLGNGGAGGDGAKSHSKDRRLEPTDEPEKPLAPKTEGETLDEPPKAAAAETSLDSKPTPKAPELTSTQPTADSGDEQVKSAQAKPILKRQNPQPQVSKNIKPVSKPKRENSEGKAYKGETQKSAPLKEKASASETDGKDGKTKHVSAGSGGAVGASGTADGKTLSEGSGVGDGQGTAFGSGNFIANGDGSYTALGSGGISYKILSEAAPRYPRAARSIGFNKVVRVRVKFLVGLDGQVETTEIITRNIPDLGFKEAAVEAVKKMKFAPIYHQGRNIKVYFQKTIVFQP